MKCHSFSEDPSQISQPFIVYNLPPASKFAFSHYFKKSNHSLARRPPFDGDLICHHRIAGALLYIYRTLFSTSLLTGVRPPASHALVLTAQPLWPDCCELGDVSRTGYCYRSQDSTHCLQYIYTHYIYTLYTQYLHSIYTLSTKYPHTIETVSN